MLNDKQQTIPFVNCSCNIKSEAFIYLGKRTKQVRYYDIFLTILEAMVISPCKVTSGWGDVTLSPGQAAVSNEELAKKFKLDPKTTKVIVNQMENLDLLRIHRTRQTTVIDVVCISGWYGPNGRMDNPLYLYAKKPRTTSQTSQVTDTQASTTAQTESPQSPNNNQVEEHSA